MAKISKITPLGSSTTYDIAAWSLKNAGRLADANAAHITDGGMEIFQATGQMTSNKPMGNGQILHLHWDTSEGWDSQLFIPNGYHSPNSMQWRTHTSATNWEDGWKTLLDSNNYTTYTVKKDGTGATGTWPISITGNAGTATKLATARTISLTGSVTGSGSFDGSGNLSITTTTNHNHYQLITEGDHRSVATTPNNYNNNLVFRGLKTNSAIDSPSSDNYSYVIGLRGWQDSSGGNAYELAFNNTGIYCRNGATTSWGSWKRIPLGDGTGASGTWGITSTNTYNLLNYSGNECTLGSSSSATNTDLWINYRSGYNGSTSDSAAQLSNYYFGNRKGNITGVVVNSDRFVGNSRASSWIDGQRYAYAPYNIGNITDTSGYWPWMRATSTAASKWFSFGTLGTSFYWMGSSTSRTDNGYDYGMSFNVANGYLQGCSRVYGAVWNDYAEYRKDNPNENQEPGRCIKELGDGSLALTTKRLERGCEIVSDTFGFAIGQDEKNGYNTPIASNGRVLAYPYESIEEFADHIGWPVCSGPNGTVSIMTEEEEEKYPSRIIGTISEIPTYEEWGTGKVKVDGRIWIRIK